jgi:hypothetical protein
MHIFLGGLIPGLIAVPVLGLIALPVAVFAGAIVRKVRRRNLR